MWVPNSPTPNECLYFNLTYFSLIHLVIISHYLPTVLTQAWFRWAINYSHLYLFGSNHFTTGQSKAFKHTSWHTKVQWSAYFWQDSHRLIWGFHELHICIIDQENAWQESIIVLTTWPMDTQLFPILFGQVAHWIEYLHSIMQINWTTYWNIYTYNYWGDPRNTMTPVEWNITWLEFVLVFCLSMVIHVKVLRV